MARRVTALLLCLLVLAATGHSQPEASSCAKDCPDDDPGSSCPAGCQECACCARIGPMLGSELDANCWPDLYCILPRETPPQPLAQPPRDIFHIPKLALA